MSIRFSCSCRKALTVKDEHAGKKVRCPQCGERVLVPQGDTDAAEDEPEEEEEPEVRKPRKNKKKKKSRDRKRHKEPGGPLISPGVRTLLWMLLVVVLTGANVYFSGMQIIAWEQAVIDGRLSFIRVGFVICGALAGGGVFGYGIVKATDNFKFALLGAANGILLGAALVSSIRV